MKQKLINSEENAPKSGKLAIALYPNQMSKRNGEVTSYYARVVNRRTLGMEDIFNDLLSDNPGLDAARLRKEWNTVLNAIAMRVSSGVSVDFGLGVLSPAITGSFASEQSEFSKSRNRITVQYRPSKDMRQVMAALDPVITLGNACRPEITRVYDHGSGWDSADLKEGQNLEYGSVSRGNLLIIEGKTLCIGGDGEEVGLWFESTPDPNASVKVDAKTLCRNRPSLLECIVPKELAEGTAYRIRVVTRYLPGNRTREVPQSFTFPTLFAVA